MTQFSEKLLQAQVGHLRSHRDGQLRSGRNHYALRGTGQWTGPDKLTINGGEGKEVMRVFPCCSDLEMREAMQQAEEEQISSILICTMNLLLVSADVLSRVVGERIAQPQTRSLLASYFQIKDEGSIDTRILSNRVLIEALIEKAPATGYPPSASGTVTLEQAWTALLKEITGQSTDTQGVFTLLSWSLDGTALAALQGLSSELKKALVAHLTTEEGTLPQLMWSVIDAGHGADLIPFGHLLALIFHSDAIHHKDHIIARGELKSLLGGKKIERAEGKEWCDAVKTFTRGTSVLPPSYYSDFLRSRLDQLLERVHLEHRAFLILSEESPFGLEHRYYNVLASFVQAVVVRSAKNNRELISAMTFLKQHSLLAKSEAPCFVRIQMGVSLWFWRQDKKDQPKTRSLLASYFQVKDEGSIDTRILSNRVLIEALIEKAPATGYPPSPSGTVTLEQAWTALLKEITGQSTDTQGVFTLLSWSLEGTALAALQGLSSEQKKALVEYLTAEEGALAQLMWSVIDAGHGADLIPFGHLLALIFHPDAIQNEDHIIARGELKSLLGGKKIERAEGKQWRDAVKTFTSGIGFLPPSYDRDFLRNRLDQLLKRFHLEHRAFLSEESPLGLEHRYHNVAESLLQAMTAKSAKANKEVASQMTFLKEHSLTKSEEPRFVRIKMAARLVGWLQDEQASDTKASFAVQVAGYYGDGCYVDRAVHHLRQTDSSREVQEVYGKILKRVRERTATASASFGKQLQSFSKGHESGSKDFLCIEDVLVKAVVPLAKEKPVLLLVLDGMSASVFRRLQEQLLQQGWGEAANEGLALPRPVLAAIPSTTAVSLRGLFLGKLVFPATGTEEVHFRDNALLHKEVGSQSKAVLYRKGKLREPGREGLAGEVRDSLINKRQKVVGIVINAIDDHLDSGSQDNRVWDLDDINPLHEVLDACREAGRWIIITSDHGHTLDYGTKTLKSKADGRGDRFRVPEEKIAEGEIELTGPRVEAGYGAERIVTAVDSKIRYGGDKLGYHGGASPQEMVIPLTFLTSDQEEADFPEGWSLAHNAIPDWWEMTPELKRVPATVPSPTVVSKKGTAKDNGQGDLFTPPTPTKEEPTQTIGALLIAGEVFLQQMQLRTPRRLEPAQVAELVTLLERNGGKMLLNEVAEEIKMGATRVSGFVQTVAKVLNIDGYQAISLDNTSQTISLDLATLRDQFDLAL